MHKKFFIPPLYIIFTPTLYLHIAKNLRKWLNSKKPRMPFCKNLNNAMPHKHSYEYIYTKHK